MQSRRGTKSYPKGVLLTHDNMLRNAATCERSICSKAIVLQRTSVHQVAGDVSLLAGGVGGACIVRIVRACERERHVQ